ncbi:FG-GAP-like repeat-containing protein [Leptospira kobayashii]|uniref:FG-GAP-like repeat-containing protein n=1 Tax=Leptospira kobayashii TaxID=1917830 RepID=UPI001FA6E916|nr:FG-GAP-like repeat-containing protein [Leptospira kobayashii]
MLSSIHNGPKLFYNTIKHSANSLFSNSPFPKIVSTEVGSIPGKFTVNGSGAVIYAIPIEVPPGTNEVAPDLEVIYDSQQSNGYLGVGWSLRGISAITRCPADLARDGYNGSIQLDSKDRFCLDGIRLQALSGIYGADGTVYHTERETWTKIISKGVCGGGPCFFEAINKDGAKIEFGNSDDSKIRANGQTGSKEGVVRVWSSNRYTDLNGNFVTNTYFQDRNSGEYYISQIDYTGNSNTNLATQRNVKFLYESRNDVLQGYIAGSSILTSKRLSEIRTYTMSGGANEKLVLDYFINYEYSASTSQSLLASLQICDADHICLPETNISWPKNDGPKGNGWVSNQVTKSFDVSKCDDLVAGDVNGDGKGDLICPYNLGNNRAQTYVQIATGNELTQWKVWGPQNNSFNLKSCYYLNSADFNGDGKSDLLCVYNLGPSSSQTWVQLSNGSSFSDWTKWSSKNTALDFSKCFSFLSTDVSGDGRTDIICVYRDKVKDLIQTYVQLAATNGFSDWKAWGPSNSSIDLENCKSIQYADLSGDGFADLVCVYRDTQNTYTYTQISNGTGLTAWTNWSPRDPGSINPSLCSQVLSGDFNGDRLMDLICTYNAGGNTSQTFIQISTGSGLTAWKAKNTKEDFSLSKCSGISLVDMNGDGKADLLCPYDKGNNETQTYVQISNGIAMSNWTLWGPETIFDLSACKFKTFTDLNGDGLTEPICVYSQSPNQTQTYTQVATSGFDLVSVITNGFGGSISMEYSTLSKGDVYMRGNDAVYPIRDEQNSLRVLKSYKNNDGRGGEYSFNYSYSGAKTDLSGYGWLGFKTMIMEEAASKRSYVTNYNQMFPNSGNIATKSNFNSSKKLQSETVYTYSDKAPAGYQTLGVHQILNTNETYSYYEGDALSYRLIRDYDYDRFGNLDRIYDHGSASDPSDSVFQCMIYANSESSWKLGYLLQAKTTDSKAGCDSFISSAPQTVTKCSDLSSIRWNPNTDLEWKQNCYDDSMNRISVFSWDDSFNQWSGDRFGFDPYGNIIQTVDMAGQTTTVNYDPVFHSFPVKTTSPPNEQGIPFVTTYEYDADFGEQASSTDPNHVTYYHELDGFGREVNVFGPNPNGDKTLLSTIVRGSDNLGIYTEIRDRSAWDETDTNKWLRNKTYMDGLEREFRSEKRGKDENQTVVREIKFNEKGQIVKTSVPYFKNDTPDWIQTDYDESNRPILTTDPDGTKEAVGYTNGGLTVVRTFSYGSPEAKTMITNLNARGLVVSKTASNSMVTTYGYDALDRLRSIKSSQDNQTVNHTYDSLSRLRKVQAPDSGTTDFDYDSKGRFILRKDSSGNQIQFPSFDNLGRVLRKRSVSDSVTIETNYSYDNNGSDPNIKNGIGRLTRIQIARPENNTWTYQFSYDAYGKIASGSANTGDRTYSYSSAFDPTGRLVQYVFPDGSVESFEYGGNEELSRISLQPYQSIIKNSYVTYSNYNALGDPGKIEYDQNDLEITRNYYSPSQGMSKLKSIVAISKKQSGSKILDKTYVWNTLDYLKEIRDGLNSNQNESFQYDDLKMGFLKQANGRYGSLNYGYDSVGNIKEQNSKEFNYVTGTNRLKSSTNGEYQFSYHPNGNLKRKKSGSSEWTYAYNAEDQLIKTEYSLAGNPTKIDSMLYDGFGERAFFQEGGSNKKTYWPVSGMEVNNYGNGKWEYTRYINGLHGPVAAITSEGAGNLLSFAEVNGLSVRYSNSSFVGKIFLPVSLIFSLFYSYLTIGNLLCILSGFVLLLAAVHFKNKIVSLHSFKKRPLHYLTSFAMGFIFIWIQTFPLYAEMIPGDNGFGYPDLGISHFVQDGQNNTVLVVDLDGKTSANLGFTPYGSLDEVGSSGKDNFRPKYSGKDWGQNSKLYYFGVRYYDPEIGRFITPDPARQFLSPYLYAQNNPKSYIDPNGDFAFLLAVVIGAVLGAYSGASAVNGDMNPAHWNWKSGKTWAGLLGGAAIGAVGGGIEAVAMEAGVAAGIAGATLIGAGEGAAFAAMGGGSAEEILLAAGIGATFGYVLGGAGAFGSSAQRFGRKGAAAIEEGEAAAAKAGRRNETEATLSACSSFPKGTKILTDQGSVSIEEIKIGQLVSSYDFHSRSNGYFPVTDLIRYEKKNLINIKTSEGNEFTVTDNHPFYINNKGWMTAKDLSKGDSLTNSEGKLVVIAKLYQDQSGSLQKVYNLEVGGAHNYYASQDQVLVHNPGGGVCRKSERQEAQKAEESRKANGGHYLRDHRLAHAKIYRASKGGGEVGDGMLGPGQYATESVPGDHTRNFSQGTRDDINRIGAQSGCHACGTKTAGTTTGNFIPDHVPALSLADANANIRLYPHCLACSNQQGGILAQVKQAGSH